MTSDLLPNLAELRARVAKIYNIDPIAEVEGALKRGRYQPPPFTLFAETRFGLPPEAWQQDTFILGGRR